MQMGGLELGDCRLPLEPLSGAQVTQFKTSLDEIGFFDIVKSS
jgi:N-acetylneuraminate lyase